MALTSIRARHFYDRLGRGQDLQAFYEDHAVGELLARGRLGQAHEVFEFGCGTGRLAARLLGEFLPVGARYLRADISDTMTSLSKARLGRFGDRAAVIQADGTGPLPRTSGAFDRFLAVYVLDLLGPAGTAPTVAEARRLLRPGGLLEVVSQPGRVGDTGQGAVGGGVRAAGGSGGHVYSHPAWPGQRQGLAGLLAGYPVTSSARWASELVR